MLACDACNVSALHTCVMYACVLYFPTCYESTANVCDRPGRNTTTGLTTGKMRISCKMRQSSSRPAMVLGGQQLCSKVQKVVTRTSARSTLRAMTAVIFRKPQQAQHHRACKHEHLEQHQCQQQ